MAKRGSSVALLVLIAQPTLAVRVSIVPVADPVAFAINAARLAEACTTRDLLQLTEFRDLEWHFADDTYPECRAIRAWLARFHRIDAYYSLHTAHRIAPGLFFYADSRSNAQCVADVAGHVAGALPPDTPLLTRDPIGVATHALAPGLFALSADALEQYHDTSLDFVMRHFQPRFVGVSEMPLGICSALASASLEQIERYNQEVARTGVVEHPYVEWDLNTQIRIMHAFVQPLLHQHSCEALLKK